MFQESLDHEDHLDRQAPKGLQEMMESQVILVRMEKLVPRDPQASQEHQVTRDSKERRETVERVSLALGDPQDRRDHQDQDSDLPLWTWRLLDFLIWILSGDCLGYQVPLALPVLLVFLVLPQEAQHIVQEHLDHQAKMGHLVNLACLVYQVQMAC